MPLACKAHTFVLAGGNGSRLSPLTERQCKPALPFGANHRVIDFVLGSLHASGAPQVDVLVQFQPEGLVEHVRQMWRHALPGFTAGHAFAETVGPGTARFRGTADAVARNLGRVAADAEVVLVFGADHVYRMDVAQMVDFHRASGAEVTIATLPVPLAEASAFGILEVESEGRVRSFREKPPRARVPAIPGQDGLALASMGNYVFSADVLRRELARCSAAETDFGQHLLPRLIAELRVMAYDFRRESAPPGAAPPAPAAASGAARDAAAPPYWRDVGTLAAYFDAHMDTLGAPPLFEPEAVAGPLLRPEAPPAQVLDSQTEAARIGAGAQVQRAHLQRAVIGRGARIDEGAVVEHSIVFPGVHIGSQARIRHAIVAEDNAIPPRERIGWDLEADRRRFPVTPDGLVVVPPSHFAAPRPN
ncbi:MAG: NTP transferase domain-containing protein [Rubrivivax sp.]|nr:NTP transferase domain-containing protein [Rubrivivax sp.]